MFIFKKNKYGFSLMEIVLIVGLLAIFLAILIPSLISYFEKGRIQKDLSMAQDITKSITIAMEDKNAYAEMYDYCFNDNFTTYSDSTGKCGSQTVDSEFWAPDGRGRCVTITLNPENGKYIIKNAIVNDMTQGNGSFKPIRSIPSTIQCYLPKCNNTGYMYSKLVEIIGEEVEINSATYKFSSLTIFIQMNEAEGNIKIDVSSGFNGTNLTSNSSVAK